MKEHFSYKKAGVDIEVATDTKRSMARSLETGDRRVLNKIGAFASLFDASFPEHNHPVLVLKTDEPGSKQKLAFEHNRISSVCHDLVNHLVNDVIVMGATPLAVLDVVVCGKLDKKVVLQIVESISEACKEQGCVLVGGETSEQPGVIEAGTYVLAGSIVGVVEKSKVIDGSKIVEGDSILAVASNGLHTNGYSLVRSLMERKPEIAKMKAGEESFLEAVFRPHTCYYHPFRNLFNLSTLHGIAHITGGGIEGNLPRILPEHLNAVIDLSRIRILPVFKTIRDIGELEDREMLHIFNMGVGMTIVTDDKAAGTVQEHLSDNGCDSYPIGHITKGERKVVYQGMVAW